MVFNQVASTAHRAMVERACLAQSQDLPLLGWIPRDPLLALPERHLGLVQAGEIGALDTMLNGAAKLIEENLDMERLISLARPSALSGSVLSPPLPPLGQHIAVARDDAYAFAYPAILNGWRQAGAELSFFSPLADEAPDKQADAVYLPGGYPELHAGRLAATIRFLPELRRLAENGKWIYGECGGYMTLGQALQDQDGQYHAMGGLLPVITSFAKRRLHLGYRQCRLAANTPFGRPGALFRGHEFHYATISEQTDEKPLFLACDAQGRSLGAVGQIAGSVIGSFLHLIDHIER